jgi:hypothetical protein
MDKELAEKLAKSFVMIRNAYLSQDWNGVNDAYELMSGTRLPKIVKEKSDSEKLADMINASIEKKADEINPKVVAEISGVQFISLDDRTEEQKKRDKQENEKRERVPRLREKTDESRVANAFPDKIIIDDKGKITAAEK